MLFFFGVVVVSGIVFINLFGSFGGFFVLILKNWVDVMFGDSVGFIVFVVIVIFGFVFIVLSCVVSFVVCEIDGVGFFMFVFVC